MQNYQEKSVAAKALLMQKLKSAQDRSPISEEPYKLEDENSPVFFLSKNLTEDFLENFTAIQGKPVTVNSESEAKQKLNELLDVENLERVFCADDDFMEWIPKSKQQTELKEDSQASVTACDYMVARTGSLVITSQLAAGRTGTIYPPIHIVIAYENQIVSDIINALDAVMDRPELPSMINLNTGPSRTADIEKTLVVGIHGPKEVHLILIKNSNDAN